MIYLPMLDKRCKSHFRNEMSLKESTDESGRIKRASPLEVLGIKEYGHEDLIFPIFPKASLLSLWKLWKGKPTL